MKGYRIYFTKYYPYFVEAETENEAIKIAEKDFCYDMCYLIADATYDEVKVEKVWDDYEEEEYEEEEEL